MAIEFRPLKLDDMDEAAIVLRCSFDQQLPWLAGLHSPDEDRWFFREKLFKENHIWGAVEARKIVGIIAFSFGWIHQLYILPRFQGQGIGTRLLAIAQVETSQLQLWTFQKNALARQFYEAKGFVAIRQTDGSGNEEKEPDVLYLWSKV